jgi:hypothetical protein
MSFSKNIGFFSQGHYPIGVKQDLLRRLQETELGERLSSTRLARMCGRQDYGDPEIPSIKLKARPFRPGFQMESAGTYFETRSCESEVPIELKAVITWLAEVSR